MADRATLVIRLEDEAAGQQQQPYLPRTEPQPSPRPQVPGSASGQPGQQPRRAQDQPPAEPALAPGRAEPSPTTPTGRPAPERPASGTADLLQLLRRLLEQRRPEVILRELAGRLAPTAPPAQTQTPARATIEDRSPRQPVEPSSSRATTGQPGTVTRVELPRAPAETPSGQASPAIAQGVNNVLRQLVDQLVARVPALASARQAAGLIAPAGPPAATGAAAPATGGAGTAAAVGAAVVVAQAVASQIAGAYRSVGESAKAASESLTRLARNDNLDGLTVAVERTGQALGKIPIVGQVLEAQLGAVATVVRSFSDTVEGFVARGRELASYSPELSAAGARAEVTSTMSDLREASELGDGLSRLTDAQTDFNTELRELLLPIKKALIEILVPIVEKATDAVEIIRNILEFFYGLRQNLESLLNAPFAGSLESIAESLKGSLSLQRDTAAREIEEGKQDALEAFWADIVQAAHQPLRRPGRIGQVPGAPMIPPIANP